jgi:hypothetical protein
MLLYMFTSCFAYMHLRLSCGMHYALRTIQRLMAASYATALLHDLMIAHDTQRVYLYRYYAPCVLR